LRCNYFFKIINEKEKKENDEIKIKKKKKKLFYFKILRSGSLDPYKIKNNEIRKKISIINAKNMLKNLAILYLQDLDFDNFEKNEKNEKIKKLIIEKKKIKFTFSNFSLLSKIIERQQFKNHKIAINLAIEEINNDNDFKILFKNIEVKFFFKDFCLIQIPVNDFYFDFLKFLLKNEEEEKQIIIFLNKIKKFLKMSKKKKLNDEQMEKYQPQDDQQKQQLEEDTKKIENEKKIKKSNLKDEKVIKPIKILNQLIKNLKLNSNSEFKKIEFEKNVLKNSKFKKIEIWIFLLKQLKKSFSLKSKPHIFGIIMVVLSILIGEIPFINCKSGKDRTGG
jgi:hypothetical protein